MYEVSLVSAFFAGIITFLAPCTLPLVPGYIAFLAGNSKKDEKVLVKRSISFISGFSSVIILIGLFVSSIGKFINSNRSLLVAIGGVLFIFFGVYLLGLFRLPILERHSVKFKFKPTSNFSAFLFGVVFSFGWSPCFGPILGSIFVLSSQFDSVIKGFLLLFVYTLGHGIPFILFAYFYDKTNSAVKILSKYSEKINKGAAVFLIVIGLFMVFGKYSMFLDAFKDIFNGSWQNSLLDYM